MTYLTYNLDVSRFFPDHRGYHTGLHLQPALLRSPTHKHASHCSARILSSRPRPNPKLLSDCPEISQTGLWRAKRSTHSGVALARKRTGLPRRTYNDAEQAPAAGASLARVQSLQPAFYTCAPRTPANWIPGTAFCACVRALAEEMGRGAALRVL